MELPPATSIDKNTTKTWNFRIIIQEGLFLFLAVVLYFVLYCDVLSVSLKKNLMYMLW